MEKYVIFPWHDCFYSKRLLDKLVLLDEKADSQIDFDEVKKAIHYARKYHGEQRRQSGEPYYSHPLEVAYVISDYLFRTDILVSSILHDTIEDTELTKEMIAAEFGELVANQVMDLTRVKEDGCKISAAETIDRLYKEKKRDVLMIKLFDRLHNMQTIAVKSPKKTNKIVEETFKKFISLSMHLGLRAVEEELHILCQQHYRPE